MLRPKGSSLHRVRQLEGRQLELEPLTRFRGDKTSSVTSSQRTPGLQHTCPCVTHETSANKASWRSNCSVCNGGDGAISSFSTVLRYYSVAVAVVQYRMALETSTVTVSLSGSDEDKSSLSLRNSTTAGYGTNGFGTPLQTRD